jgi:hypothetical protein
MVVSQGRENMAEALILTSKMKKMKRSFYIVIVSFAYCSPVVRKNSISSLYQSFQVNCFGKQLNMLYLVTQLFMMACKKLSPAMAALQNGAMHDQIILLMVEPGENQINVVLNGLSATTGSASWDNLYLTIARANLAIKHLPDIPDLSEVQRNNYLAQAYGIRAYMYFWAVRLWGAVPVRLEPYEDINESPNLARTSADEVLNNVIISDLVNANTLVDKNAINVFELNKGGILAILAEVYLWKKDYTNVLSTIDQLIALNQYALTPSTPVFLDL